MVMGPLLRDDTGGWFTVAASGCDRELWRCSLISTGQATECETDGENLAQSISTAPAGTIYDVKINCYSDAGAGVCNNPVTCDAPPGSVLYDVLVSTDNGQTFTQVSTACLTNPPAGGPPVITPDMVAQQFRAIAWPESPLTIQPPGGRTLVNLATNFFTTNVEPRTQTVALLGQAGRDRGDAHDLGLAPRRRHRPDLDRGPGAAYPGACDHPHLRRRRGHGGAERGHHVRRALPGERRRVGHDPGDGHDRGASGALEVVSATPQLVAAD